jgi:hypothetical protein
VTVVLKATSAAPPVRVMATRSASPAKATGVRVLMVIAARVWTATVAPARMAIVVLVLTETGVCVPMATVVATPKAATASLSCPAVRQRISNQSAHYPSLAKATARRGGFALLLLAA